MTRYYLGLSTSGHDGSLALVDEDGHLLFAESTERFVQVKRAWGIAPDHVDHLKAVLAAHCASDASFVVATTWAHTKAGGPTQTMDTLFPASEGQWLRKEQQRVHERAGDALALLRGPSASIERRDYEHHRCHAAYACAAAPFDEGLCLVLDGEGDVGSASCFHYREGSLERAWRSWGPGSLGAYYGWLTGLCGFDWRAGEEWKVMGLAAFGSAQPGWVESMSSLLVIDRGRIRLAPPEVLATARETMASRRRGSDRPLMDAADLAASGQAAYASLADAILEACAPAGERLILTGGCALNSSFNGTVLGRHPFREVFVPAAPGDDGNAVGAALLAWQDDHPGAPLPKCSPRGPGSAFLGSSPNFRTIEAVARGSGLKVTDATTGSAALVAERLADGKILGIMRGRAEFGPRALGHRSILADPRGADMKDRINRAVKGREPYRPFAPMLRWERSAEWFVRPQPSPYMSFALRWNPGARDRVPAVVHQDGTGRLQTVHDHDDPWLQTLLDAFERRTGIPIVLNTSFNVMGKPIVHAVEDAMAVLTTTGLDAVLLENVLVEKT